MSYADKYIEENDLPKHTQIETMAQFGETAMFKQFFEDWRDEDETGISNFTNETSIKGFLTKFNNVSLP